MKSLLLLFVGLAVGLAGGVIYFKSQRTPTAPIPVVESTPASVATVPEQPDPTVIKSAIKPVETRSETSPVTNFVVDKVEIEAAAAFRKGIDALLSPQLTSRQKQDMFEQFRINGQMDQVITELKRRAMEDPTDAAIPTTLGEALLLKVGSLHAAGGDLNEIGILAMQADQSFNAALKIDPANWEAQFVKYSTMFYWPPEPTRDNEAAQKLSNLIDQQEALPQQPHFAQTYIALGNQYQKIGQTDMAQATWQLGLQKFPNNSTLLKKIAPRQ